MSTISATDEHKDTMDAGILLNGIYGSIARTELCSVKTLRIVLNRLRAENKRLYNEPATVQKVIEAFITLVLSEINSSERGDYN